MAKPWLAIYFMPLMVLIPIGLMNLAPRQSLRANKWPGCSCIFSIRKIFEEDFFVGQCYSSLISDGFAFFASSARSVYAAGGDPP
jgi:hypothetical protein